MEFKKEIEALKYSELLLKSLQGQITEDEEQELKDWIESSKENKALHNELSLVESRSQAYNNFDRYPVEESYTRLRIKLRQKTISLWTKVATAAAVLVLIGFAFIFFNKYDQSDVFKVSTAKQDFSPGKNKATLMLDNGDVVSLSSNQNVLVIKSDKFQYEDGSKIKDGVNGSIDGYQTISTPNSGFYQVVLSDGTRVYLNSASSLRFPVRFSRTERKVKVTGEAYFEVAKVVNVANFKKVPFIVETSGQEIEVLGTHFNVNDYNLSTKTTLVEGAVKVKSLSQSNKHQSVILKPGQQSILNNNNFEIKMVDTDVAVAWKNGYFNFDEESLESIMDQVARWYNVKVYFDNEKLKQEPFSGIIKKDTTASELLKVLEKAGDVRFEIEQDRIIVIKK